MRTDIHRKGAIVPADYSYVMSYSLSTSQDGWPVPSYNVNCIIDTHHTKTTHSGNCCLIGMFSDPTKKFAKHGSTGKCTICGAAYVYGDVWQHGPTGEYIHVGHDCADKMNSQDRRAFEHGRVKYINGQIKLARLAKFCEENEGMKLVFSCADKNHIIADMRSKVMEWGNLSEKQIAFAKKLADTILNPAPTEDEPEPLLLKDGRGEYTGRFVAFKSSEGPYGYVMKGLFIVVQDGKQAKVWMTVPSGYGDEKNVEATIVVALSKGDKAGFYFGNRPKLLKVLDTVECN
jgi:hypothetical protein